MYGNKKTEEEPLIYYKNEEIEWSEEMEPLFLQGIFQEKIWGGTKLRDIFEYDIPSEKTGELWAISAHPSGPSIIKNGEFANKTLLELWKTRRDLFGYLEESNFPLLTKIIDAQDDLSVQVHPGDKYALLNHGELGKTECWYILSAEENAKIIMGHNANTEEEFLSNIENGKWKKLLKTVEVKAGDFFYVPSGTVHAIGKGVMVLETQQSSDITYRLFDYNRKDDDGNLRDLHLQESIDVSKIPHVNTNPDVIIEKLNSSTKKRLVSNEFFTVYEWFVSGEDKFYQESLFTLASVVEGKGEIILNGNSFKIKAGDHFILLNNIKDWTIKGEVKIIASHP